MPRFVNRNGNLVFGRNWALDDRMVNVDEDTDQWTQGDETVKVRDVSFPLVGERKRIDEIALQPMCQQLYDGELYDFIIRGYDSCALQFTQRQFNESIYEDEDGTKLINVYINHPSEVNSWIETCTTINDRICETKVLQQGLDYQLTNDDRF